jgi:hypothetical protein
MDARRYDFVPKKAATGLAIIGAMQASKIAVVDLRFLPAGHGT